MVSVLVTMQMRAGSGHRTLRGYRGILIMQGGAPRRNTVRGAGAGDEQTTALASPYSQPGASLSGWDGQLMAMPHLEQAMSL